jgi:outer membrane PBP1 activator LpoA protein
MRLYKPSLIGLGAILLAACSTSPVTTPFDSADRESAAIAAMERGDFAAAQNLYSALVERSQGAERARYQVALARTEIGLRRPDFAVSVLDEISGPVAPELELDIAAVRASALFLLGQTVDAVTLLVDREIWLESSADILDNQSLIWDGLSEPLSLASASYRSGDATIDGWLALAPLTRLTDDSERFLDALNDWRQEFSAHPAAGGILAARLADLRGAGVRPTKIALLLPLSSELRLSALAVQQGFFAAHLDSESIDQISIQVYDTTSRGSVESFLTAQLEGADFIVGPLTTEEVELIQSQAGFIPTLALNLAPPGSIAASNFFQFALSSDDEVEAIAARAIADGHRTAGILYASSDRGYDQRDRFREAFESRGGRVINSVVYVPGSANLAAPIEELLNISQSEERNQRLRANLGRPIEFEARRRADIDMIFLQVDPAGGDADARLLVPLLRDNDASPTDLPTFATRDVFDPARRQSNADLNGLVFTDVPLLVDPSHQSASSRLSEFSPASAIQSPRLFAFGYDAYRLVSALFSAGQTRWPVSGSTGDLYLGENGRIRRILPFAVFSEGQPQALATTVAP